MADEIDPDGETIPGFSDAEIAEQIAPYLDEVEADYDSQFDELADVFRAKGPADTDD